MKECVVRIRVHELVYKKYRIACLEKNLSVPKQTMELIRKFLENYDTNRQFIKE
jgi:hypothetical protein